MRKVATIFGLAMMGAAVMAQVSAAQPAGVGRLMEWGDLTGRPRPTGATRIVYCADPLQHVDLWKPAGKGPYPVVLMVHGGCWQTDVADASLMDWAAADLATRGIAVWNIEYRGVDRAGGGWPGTFQDVAAAADMLGARGKALGLKTERIVAIGHSAGGHLALWLAQRPRLARTSVLWRAHPLKLSTAISIGGLPDLEAASVAPGNTCGTETVDRLVGARTAARPDVYAETSPARTMPPAVPTVLINAARDRIAPPAFAAAYAGKAGGRIQVVTVPDEGHAELIAPGSRAWAVAVAAIETALGR